MYLDTAYIAKTYVNEPDSAAVRALLIGKRNMHSSALCGPEFYCVLQRHVREGSLTKRQAALLREKYHEDVEAGVWTLIPMDNAVRLLHLIERSQLHVFGRCGHWTQIEHAAEFNQLLLRFLR